MSYLEIIASYPMFLAGCLTGLILGAGLVVLIGSAIIQAKRAANPLQRQPHVTGWEDRP